MQTDSRFNTDRNLKSGSGGGIDAVENKLRTMARNLGPGSRLPSVRTLMRTCAVSQLSVSQALAKLESQGVIDRRPKSGIFVADSPRHRPRLVICEPNLFINPSPFSEILLESVCKRYIGTEEGIVVRFSNPLFFQEDQLPARDFLPSDLWQKLEAQQYSSIFLFGTHPRLTPHVLDLNIPVVAFGTDAPYMIRIAMLDACQAGVAELARLGCKKVSLYNTPYLPMREVFMAALESHQVDAAEIGHDDLFDDRVGKRLIRRYSLVERGRSAAHRAVAAGNLSRQGYGILSLDDTFTQGFIHGLIDHGLKVGEDVEIATYSNKGSPVLGPWEPNLTRLELDIAQMANEMHECADSLVEGAIPSRNWMAAGRHSWGPVWYSVQRLAVKHKGSVSYKTQLEASMV